MVCLYTFYKHLSWNLNWKVLKDDKKW
jgi:hypothetical protein